MRLISARCIFGILILLGALAGCSSPGPVPTATSAKPAANTPVGPAATSAAPAAPTAALVATPATKPTTQPQGEIKIAVQTLYYNTLDPASTDVYAGSLTGYTIFDPLVGVDANGKPSPGIAERWEQSSPDGKAWTFYIRKGVKFQDGSDLTGADVKFSYDRVLAPAATSGDAAYLRKIIDNVQLKDDYTVVFNFKVPQGELFKGASAANGASSAIVPKKYIEEKGVDYFRAHPIGSGPWKFVKLEAGHMLQLEAVGNWRATPQFKTVTILVVPDEATRVAMLRTGEVDMAQITFDSTKTVKDAGLRVLAHNGGEQAGVGFYYDMKEPAKYPVSDVRVRTALSLAINRQELADKLFQGYARPSAVFYLPSTIYFYDANVLKAEPYDPQQAKKLLADAGYPNGFEMKFYSIPRAPYVPTLNEAIVGYWEKIGVKSSIVSMEASAMIALRQKNNGFYNYVPELWGNATTWTGVGITIFNLDVAHHSTLAPHKNHANVKLDQLIEQTQAAMDPVQRTKLAQEASLEAQKEHAMVGVMEFDAAYGVGKKIGGWTPAKGINNLALGLETITHGN